MIYEPNYIYKLTAEQFTAIVKEDRTSEDPLVKELLNDAFYLSAMQASNIEPMGKTRSLNMPSGYYHGFAFKQEVQNKLAYQKKLTDDIDYDSYIPSFEIEGSVELNIHDLKNLTAHHINLSNCSFKDDVTIREYLSTDNELSEHITFGNCTFSRKISIDVKRNVNLNVVDKRYKLSELKISFNSDEKSMFSRLSMGNCFFVSLQILDANRNEIVVSKTVDAAKNKNLFFDLNSSAVRGTYDPNNEILEDGLKLGECVIDVLKITMLDNKQNNVINMIGISVIKFSLTGYINSTDSLIKNTKVFEKMSLSNLNCFGKLKFHNIITSNAIMQIVDSDLGKSDFINFHFGAFKHIETVDSKFSEINLSKCTAPKSVIGISNTDHIGARDGVKQFRQAFNKSGDKIQEMYLIPKEYEEHYKSLIWRDSWEVTADKAVLLFNRSSNFYGQSVGKAFATTLLFSTVSYAIYCLLLGIRPGCDTEETGKVVSFFLEYINPLHKPEYLTDNLLGKNSCVSNSARFCEGFSKIIITYLLYQFIQAFRKYGRQ